MNNNYYWFIIITTVFGFIFGTKEDLFDEKQGIKMGVLDTSCDDGKTSLDTDWDDSPDDYTCYDQPLPVKNDTEPVEECDDVPDNYSPRHFCMNDTISYDHILPTHGDHRPVWPKFGEYRFVPLQRWSHNVEHGAIIMLYHPCADPNQVEILRKLVVGCLRKHIITQYNFLPEERPFALIGWGCRLQFSKVDKQMIISFIRKRALHGPEGNLPKEGQYVHMMLKLAQPPPGSDMYDFKLCPDPNGY